MGKGKLHIADDLTLPLDFVVGTAGAVATKGMGKSHLAQVAAEELLELGQTIVAIDPTDAWWGLRSSADGLSDGYPVVVFGGDHGDLKLDPDAGAQIAEAVVAERFSCVICTDGLSDTAEIRFVRTFLDTLYRRNREPIHVFIDEADIFAPQKPFEVEDSRSIRAMSHIVRRGRKKGIGSTLITQRPSELNKSVLSQVETLFVLGMSHNLDIDAVERWMRLRKKKSGDNAAYSLMEEMVESLDSLPQGDAWLWSPRQKLHQRFRARPKRTFDSGATPKPGQRVRVAKKLAHVDIERLGTAIAAAAERQREDDPAHLRARVAKLKADLHSATVDLERERTRPAKIEIRTTKPVAMVDLKRAESLLAKVNAAIEKARELGQRWEAIGKLAGEAISAIGTKLEVEAAKLSGALAPPKPIPEPSVQRPQIPRTTAAPRAVLGASDRLPIGEQKILAAAIQHRGVGREQLTVLVGYKRSARDTYISRLGQRGFVVIDGQGLVMPTPAGIATLPDPEPLPTGTALQNYWFARLPRGERVLFEQLVAAYPEWRSREDIGGEYKRSARDTYLSRLGARGLVVLGRGTVRASDTLFEGSN